VLRARFQAWLPILLLALAGSVGVPAAQESVDTGVIRLRAGSGPAPGEPQPSAALPGEITARRGFDYDAFEGRLESLWFQRKALLADGRDADALRQAEQIRDFCAEEGIRRLEPLAGALVAEAQRQIELGRYQNALDSLALAEEMDPGRSQIHLARAAVLRESRQGFLLAGRELLAAARAALVRSVRDLTLFNRWVLLAIVAFAMSLAVFALLMLLRHNVAFRHEVEEWLSPFTHDIVARFAGWALIFLPLLVWFAAGWVALFWIVITVRFARRAERMAALAFLVMAVLAVPAYHVALTFYAMTTDPLVRTTLASAGGEYDPDRILELRRLVDEHPDDPAYRFLLAGLYKNGRYFDEAFGEYKQALKLNPSIEEAQINVGNIFYTTGQHAEAIARYQKALDLNPRSVLAFYNMHLAQSESFNFKEAEASLRSAREIDGERVTELLAGASSRGNRPPVIDAVLPMTSIWQAALEGGGAWRPTETATSSAIGFRILLNPVSVVSFLALIACAVQILLSQGQAPARRCIRCGRPFCHYCKSSREGHEYCSQCLHLFVLGDGLAPDAKRLKLYEVERHERRTRRARKWISTLLPGAAHVLGGKPMWGALLLGGWFVALVTWQPELVYRIQRLVGSEVRADLLSAGPVPAMFDFHPFVLVAVQALMILWYLGTAWRWRSREV
jgi:tetratricopeptide (TPR) repeat protein